MQTSLYRTRYHTEGLSFCSNDYLGLSQHPTVIDAFQKAANTYGIGSGGSQLLGAYTKAHQMLEEELAEFLGYERVLLFSTGYMANLGVITTLIKKSDSIYGDRLNHASLVDACRYSGANFKRYRQVEQIKDAHHIISDGVFSMDGHLAPLKALSKISTSLIIDDSHGIGILGKNGKGSTEHHAVNVSTLTSSFGKAFGTFGGFVASKANIIEKLIQSARTAIYTTALPPAIAEATRASLYAIKTESWRRDRLNSLIKYFCKNTCQLSSSSTPIQPILIGSAEQTMRVFSELRKLGLFVGAIRPPTVPQHQSRLRISLNVNHTEKQIDELLEKLHVLL